MGAVTLTEAQWKAVAANLRLVESVYQGKLLEIEQLITEIERANNIVTYVLWVRWRDANSPHPRAEDNPQEWPPTLTAQITKIVPITRTVVEDFVATRTRNPAGIWVTQDPAGQVGWKRVEDM